MPPSKVMGLPFKRWGATDQTLVMLRAEMRALLCGCGCGQLASESHDEETAGRWLVKSARCQARVALSEFREANPDEVDDASLLSVRLVAADDWESLAEIRFDPAHAAAINEAHLARLKLKN